ncbi:MAG: hypothetical protein JWM34_4362 [Ilumatobacteraceae bacterium]|nr:hypothetical protein [Ilumatobacteraceae bacterium]
MASGHSYPPVVGVSYADYLAVIADAARQTMQTGQVPHGPDAEHPQAANPYNAAAQARGIDPTKWLRVQMVWGCRTMLDPELGTEMARDMAGALNHGMVKLMTHLMPMGSMPAPPPVDPNDPRLAPVQGVTIEAYVRFVATGILYPGMTLEQSGSVAVGQLGFPAAWEPVAQEWGNRVMAGPPVNLRYAELVCQLLQ